MVKGRGVAEAEFAIYTTADSQSFYSEALHILYLKHLPFLPAFQRSADMMGESAVESKELAPGSLSRGGDDWNRMRWMGEADERG
jgi:hypothetical protein